MKMNEKSLCCEDCFQIIATQSSSAAKLWLDLCDVQGQGRVYVGYVPDDCPMINLLENGGYVISTESGQDDYIKVHAKMRRSEDNEVYFCGGNCDEYEEEED